MIQFRRKAKAQEAPKQLSEQAPEQVPEQDQMPKSAPDSPVQLFDMGMREAQKAVNNTSLLIRFRAAKVNDLHEVLSSGDSDQVADMILDMSGQAMASAPMSKDRRLLGMDGEKANRLSRSLLKMVVLAAGDDFRSEEGALLRLESITRILRYWIESGEGSEMLRQTSGLVNKPEARMGLASALVMPLALSASVLRARRAHFNFSV